MEEFSGCAVLDAGPPRVAAGASCLQGKAQAVLITYPEPAEREDPFFRMTVKEIP
jgi:hypothetical protein